MEERLRIAVFSDSFLPILNGVSISIDSLVTELRNRGHSVHVYTASSPFYKDPDPNTYRFPAFETPWTRQYPLAVPPFYWMLRHFRRHQYDIIHTHTPFTLGFVGLRWGDSHDIPVVSTYHTLYDRYAHYIPFFPRRYVRFKIAKHTNFYYNKVAHVITPSHAAYRWLRRHSVTTPMTVIPTGAPPRGFFNRSEIRQQMGVTPEQRILLYVGRIAKEKNLATLFQMAAQVFSQDPHLRLWLVGDGPYRVQCAQIARDLGIGDRVTFVGFVPRDQVDKFYTAADLFVFSSITETQGLVVQEAMSYGLPAIAVAGGGASAGIKSGENGFIVKNDPKEFAERVLETIGNTDLYERFSIEASNSVRVYGTQDMAQAVLRVYEQVIKEHRLKTADDSVLANV